MAASHSIPPFPVDVDRDRFGDWLAGFTDGEGCFYLALSRHKARQNDKWVPKACFQITLRADDEDILRRIQAYWECGSVRFTLPVPGAKPNTEPACQYRIDPWRELARIVVPHFDRHPLQAKKRKDFALWREAILLGFEGSQRQQKLKWTADERAHFQTLHAALRDQRRYDAPPVERPAPEVLPLFDDPD